MIIPCKDLYNRHLYYQLQVTKEEKNRNYDVIYLTGNRPHNVQGLMPRENRHV